MATPTITSISPDLFSVQDYTFADSTIVPSFDITPYFQPEEDYTEYFIYDANSNLLTSGSLSHYTFPEGPGQIGSGNYNALTLDPQRDLESNGYSVGQYNIVYNFFEPQLASNQTSSFYIKEISSDRTELRLASNFISGSDIVALFPSFLNKIQDPKNDYFNEFYLNFGNNQIIIAVNSMLEGTDVLIKLYEPLQPQFDLKSTCWVVIKISDPLAYGVDFLTDPIPTDEIIYLAGPNTNIDSQDQTSTPTNLQNYSDIVNSTLTSSFQQVNSLMAEKGINISIDYTDFSNFIHFSSAEQRLLNFYTKVSLIESYQNEINSMGFAITGSTSSSYYISGSNSTLQNKINDVIKNFDAYEYFLYFESSSYAWPKQNTEPPYVLYSTGSTQVLDWIGNSDEDAGTVSPSPIFPYGKYGGLALSASIYDNNNLDNLFFTIPELIRNNTDNKPYELFIEMMGQHFDNIWVYYKDVTNKYNADNRLNYGISKDLVAQAIRDFGLKIYSNNFSDSDLYSAFLGITPEGSLLPSTGSELITNYVTASSDVMPLSDTNKMLYKRLYHNLPYLLKKKGTLQGIKALIASYGIPNTILRISEFGGKDRDNSNDWDYWYNKFNYSFYTTGSNSVNTNWKLNPQWNSSDNVPNTVQFRFKTEGLPTSNIPYSQSLWRTTITGSLSGSNPVLTLTYTGSGYASGSYSGSVVDPYYQYGTLTLYGSKATYTLTASIYLPFFDGGWWSVMVTRQGNTGYTLYAANNLYEGDDASLLGFSASASLLLPTSTWTNASTISSSLGLSDTINSKTYTSFSGSFQELRYFNTILSESVFYDYVMNPLSIEGNGINSSPDQLVFRAPLGSELENELPGGLAINQTSFHPKITGSWVATSSFENNSQYTFAQTASFEPNNEFLFEDQPAVGLKNRIADKVRIATQITPSGSVLSKYRSIEQALPLSQSYTPDVNMLEVAFSPQNEINDDIIESIGYFNVGNYIGDPRYWSSSRTDYEDLSRLSNEYFLKYTHNFRAWDYIRLIKYFDNSLFKMIKDFVPAKTSLTTGVVVKQHLLERNRYPQPQISIENDTYSGSISIGNFTGGPGGSVSDFNQLAYNPYEQSINTKLPGGELNLQLTQSKADYVETVAGRFYKPDNSQAEFYNGQYSGSALTVTTQSLNPDCRIFLNVNDTPILYSASFYGTDEFSDLSGASSAFDQLIPPSGWVYVWSDTQADSEYLKIRMSRYSATGIDLNNSFESLNYLQFINDGTNHPFPVAQKQENNDYWVFTITDIFAGNGSVFNSFNNRVNLSFTSSLKTTTTQPLAVKQSLAATGSWEVFNEGNFDIYQGGTNNNIISAQYFPNNVIRANTSQITGSIIAFGATTCSVYFYIAPLDMPDTELASTGRAVLTPSTPFTINPSNIGLFNTGSLEPISINPGARYALYYSQTAGSAGSTIQFTAGFSFVAANSFTPQTVGTTDMLVDPYLPAKFLNTDCDVLAGNAENERESSYYYDVDYSTNAAFPVNQAAILSGNAVYAQVQDSNYTTLAQIYPRYDGTRSTSTRYNLWSPGDEGTYGKSPTVDYQNTYYAYFDSIQSAAPELKGKSLAHIQFLIDESGNVFPPDSSSLFITQNTFHPNTTVLVNQNDPYRSGTPTNMLNGSQQVVRGGVRVDTLLYSDSGSTWRSTISFDTGSFSVTNYEFSANRSASFTAATGTATLYNFTNTLTTNAQWDLGTDTFTFASNTNSPVKFTYGGFLSYDSSTTNIKIYIVKNWTSGTPTPSQILSQYSYSNKAGASGYLSPSLDTGYLNFNSGDTVEMVYLVDAGTVNVIYGTFASLNQINPNGSTIAPYWTTGSSGDTWVTSSLALGSLYGQKQLNIIPYNSASTLEQFDPIIQNFTAKPGDEIRFLGSEAFVRMINKVILPADSSDGKLYLELNSALPTSNININHFLLRRYVDDASYVILDITKPVGGTSPGTILPDFPTTQLGATYVEVTQDIVKSIQ